MEEHTRGHIHWEEVQEGNCILRTHHYHRGTQSSSFSSNVCKTHLYLYSRNHQRKEETINLIQWANIRYLTLVAQESLEEDQRGDHTRRDADDGVGGDLDLGPGLDSFPT